MIVLIVFELWTSLRFDPFTKTKTGSSAPTALPAGAWEFPSFSTFAVVASLEIQENQIKMIMIKNRRSLMIFGLAVLIKSGITVLTKRLVFAVVLVCASVFWVVETQNFHDVSSVPIGPIWTEFIGRPCYQFIITVYIYIYIYIYIHIVIYMVPKTMEKCFWDVVDGVQRFYLFGGCEYYVYYTEVYTITCN